MRRCKGIATSSGKRCTAGTDTASGLCWKHDPARRADVMRVVREMHKGRAKALAGKPAKAETAARKVSMQRAARKAPLVPREARATAALAAAGPMAKIAMSLEDVIRGIVRQELRSAFRGEEE